MNIGENFCFSKSTKLFVASFMCVLGLSYIPLLLSIWIDTEMKVCNIQQAYGGFEFAEMVEHTGKHISWFAFTFGLAVLTFLLTTNYSQKVKSVFAVLPFVLIISDIGSMWLIRFAPKIFCWQLWFSGFLLAICFLTIFLLTVINVLFRKCEQGERKI
ncbi:MAG: hypothetical protein AUJ74_06965 [Candidatus Omnitrophica bacterium CG1_02_44_16]|nr:MAG: hypothetical protein AUJ74_06965 [Candidatus Omnitrophica bacterium CG1_02_44_16]PIY82233.1 MAG: hypothetical protein COY78_07290 [Candidatus Omnitrophica bacterium CG_4_10_14_0_8_um_filter_44_12]PIZ83633.1 MAG: hypothetical protein COX96_07050 [Candidatus Omnitrophica bacterium CG_4_10_14_0_2_um_filter_44_9]